MKKQLFIIHFIVFILFFVSVNVSAQNNAAGNVTAKVWKNGNSHYFTQFQL